MEHTWISSSSYSSVPRFAIKGGYDCDLSTIYLGRCHHEGVLLPAKVIPGKGCAYISWDGKEHVKQDYEILLGPGYGWIYCDRNKVPDNAVSGGHCSDFELLYIGRGRYNGSLLVGKIKPSHACLYITVDGLEKELYTFEFLVHDQSDTWLPATLECPPDTSVVAGTECGRTTLFVARAMVDGVKYPAKYAPDRGEAYVAYKGSEIKASDIEVLCGYNYSWMKPQNNDIPSTAVFTGRQHDGQPMILGRARYGDSVIPGLVCPDEGCVIIPYGGSEIRVDDYQILMRM